MNKLKLLKCIDSEGMSELIEGETYLLLGEIEGMEWHIAVVDNSGKVYWGIHEDRFKII